jgi:hypothetical protein
MEHMSAPTAAEPRMMPTRAGLVSVTTLPPPGELVPDGEGTVTAAVEVAAVAVALYTLILDHAPHCSAPLPLQVMLHCAPATVAAPSVVAMVVPQ